MNLLLAIIARLPLYYLYVTLALGAMALLRLPFASFLFRLFAAYATLCGCALYGVAASIALRLVGRHRSSQWATGRAFKWSMRVTCGLRFNILAGAEHLEGRPVVLVGNHQTALDVLMLGTVFPRHCSVTAKTSLRHAPFLGWFMALSGTVFIDRGNRQSAVKAFAGAAAEMRDQRQSVFIFPEGTRSGTQRPMMLPFKKGAFHLAIQAKVPIVPVITAVYSGVLCPKQMRFRRGVIPVIVLPPIPTAHLDASQVDELSQFTYDRMLDALTKLTESPSGQQAWQAVPPPIMPSAAQADEKFFREFCAKAPYALPAAANEKTKS